MPRRWQRQEPFLKTVDTWTDVMVLDHLGVPLVRLLARTSVRPTHVTVFGIGLRGVAALLFARRMWSWGVALYVLGLVLDGADGKLARLRGESSRRGAALDASADFGLFVALWFALGLAQGVPLWILLPGSAAGVASAFVTASSPAVHGEPGHWGRMMRRPGVLELHVLVFAIAPLFGRPLLDVAMGAATLYFIAAWGLKLARLGVES